MYWKWRYGPNGEADPRPGIICALILCPLSWPIFLPVFLYFTFRRNHKTQKSSMSRYEKLLKAGFESYKKTQRGYSLDNEKEFNLSLEKANRRTEELLKKYENADEETKRKMERDASLHDQYMGCYIFDAYKERIDREVREKMGW